jgi:hypothetical protein
MLSRSNVVVVSWAENRLEIVARRQPSGLLHKSWDGSSWQPSQTDWEPLGGKFIPWW